jgi:hypothetical protein
VVDSAHFPTFTEGCYDCEPDNTGQGTQMVDANNPLFGANWSMEAGSSAFSTAFTPSNETRLYEAIDNGYTLTVRGTVDGEDYEWGYTALYDGEAHPVHGREDVDSIRIYELDDRRTVGLFEKALSPGGPYARGLSEDGRELTVQAAGRHADGTPFFDVIVYRLD